MANHMQRQMENETDLGSECSSLIDSLYIPGVGCSNRPQSDIGNSSGFDIRKLRKDPGSGEQGWQDNRQV